MATEFKILRGYKDNLVDEYGNSKLPPKKLINGYWYLTNDTAEVYVALEIDGVLQLKKINDCDINSDFSALESFESRLEALEADRTHVYGYRKDFPVNGQRDHLYIAADEHRTYVFVYDQYIPIADKFESEDHDNDPSTPEVRVIYGGSAD